MTKKKTGTKKQKKHPLTGTWVDINPYESEVEFTVSIGAKGVSVKARDPNDGETARVSGVSLMRDNISREQLSFTCYWPSTGRITINRLGLIARGRVQLIFTYTDSTTMIRKPSK
ncbi:MAG: hypothetical protein EPN97_10955 [Alphaproteobacteria bacterium]|nr:MAG: hypothetical protein EPN97_10955 [Alphaproteobacteria bacterium]